MTYGLFSVMQARITDEVLGGVTTAQITNAVCDAIARYQDQRFWFNEFRMEIGGDASLDGITTNNLQTSILGMLFPMAATIPGQEYYGPNSDVGTGWPFLQAVSRISTMEVLGFGSRYKLDPRTPEWLDDHAVNPAWRGMPTDWGFVAGRVRLYPCPDAAYPVLLTGTALWPLPVNGTDASPWMTTGQGEELIRCAAEVAIYARLLRNQAMASMLSQDEQRALATIREKSGLRTAPAGVRVKSWF